MATHATVWIDHKEARVFHIYAADSDALTVTAPKHNIHHKHPGSTARDKEHPEDTKRFFAEVGHALAEAEEILVVGPSTAKLEFFRYVQTHDAQLEARIIGIETVDHPTDNQLVAFARSYFQK